MFREVSSIVVRASKERVHALLMDPQNLPKIHPWETAVESVEGGSGHWTIGVAGARYLQPRRAVVELKDRGDEVLLQTVNDPSGREEERFLLRETPDGTRLILTRHEEPSGILGTMTEAFLWVRPHLTVDSELRKIKEMAERP
ncbi:MAG: SRPBCC family protein [Methanobacteriota archaeon]